MGSSSFSVRVSGTPLHHCMGTAGCGAIFKLRWGFPSGARPEGREPLGSPWSAGSSAHGTAAALLLSAGRDAGWAGKGTCCHRLPPALPSTFLLKPANVGGWKASACKGHIYGPWSLLEQQGLCWKQGARGTWWQRELKPVLGSSFSLQSSHPQERALIAREAARFKVWAQSWKELASPILIF